MHSNYWTGIRPPAPNDLDWSPMPLTAPVRVHIDPSQAGWYDRFFETWVFDSAADVLEAIGSMEISVDAIAKSDDLARLGLSGWLYWTLYIKGFFQRRDERVLSAGNLYVDYVTRYGSVHNHDPGVASEFSSLETALARVERRYQDFEALRHHAAEGGLDYETISPISCQVMVEPRVDTKTLVDCDSGEGIAASAIDGYHRLFVARLFGLRRLPCDVTFEIDGRCSAADERTEAPIPGPEKGEVVPDAGGGVCL